MRPTAIDNAWKARQTMSPAAAWAYNVLTMGLIFPWVFSWGPSSFPSGSLPLGILVALAFQLPISIAYCYLASEYPEDGGDYVFQKHALGQGIAFVSLMSGFVLWVLFWIPLSGSLTAELALSPLFTSLARHAGVVARCRDDMQSVGCVFAYWGSTVADKDSVRAISVIQAALATVLLARGIRPYVVLQRFLLVATLVAFGLVLWTFLSVHPCSASGTCSFAQHIGVWVDPGNADSSAFYHEVVLTAASIPHSGRMQWAGTAAIAPIAWTSLQWASYHVEQGGAVRGGRSFVTQLWIVLGATLFVGIALAILAWSQEHAVGADFIRGVAAVANQPEVGSPNLQHKIVALNPAPNVFAIALGSSAWLAVLISLGYLANAFQITCNSLLGMSRIMVAMASDGLLPQALSRRNERTGAPTWALWTYFAASLPVIWMYTTSLPGAPQHEGTNSIGDELALVVTCACGGVFVLSSLSAALVALLHEGKAAPLQSVGTRRVVACCGLLGCALGAMMLFETLFIREYGVTSRRGLGAICIVLSVVVSAAWYGIARWRRREGGSAREGPAPLAPLS